MTLKTKAPSFTRQQAVDLWRAAMEAGRAAAYAATPVPMVVGSPTTPLGSVLDWSKPVEVVSGGICGMGYVRVVPGNSSFARHMVAERLMRRDSYAGGVMRSVGLSGDQSYTRNVAYAAAAAAVLAEAGIKAYADSRVD